MTDKAINGFVYLKKLNPLNGITLTSSFLLTSGISLLFTLINKLVLSLK